MMIQSTMSKLAAKIRGFASASSGNVTTLFALSIIPVVGGVGAAIDFSQANSIRTAMQAASDAASLGTVKVASTLTAGQLQTTAASLFNSSFNRPGITPTITASYDAASNKVTVAASAGYVPSIVKLLGVSLIPLSTLSKAVVSPRTWQVCVLVTDPDSNHTLLAQGASKIDFTNCMVQVNTQNWDAVESRDTSYIHSVNGENCFVGDIHYGDVIPAKNPTCTFFPDPYTGKTVPASASTCNYTQLKVTTNNTVLSPGTYCRGLEIQNVSNVTFSPGLYIITGDTLQMQGSSSSSKLNVTATGVTFLLAGQNAGLDLKNVNFNITPATTVDPYSGFLFFLDQTPGSDGKTHYQGQSKFDNVQMNASGVIYLVGQQMQLTNQSAITLNPGSIIAGYILPTNGSSLNLTGTLNSSLTVLNQLKKTGASSGGAVLTQ